MAEEVEKKQGVCKTLIKFLFSHVGLILMVILYVVAGAFIFEHLEQPNELQICWIRRQAYLPIENNTLENIYSEHMNILRASPAMTKDEIKAAYQRQIIKYLQDVLTSEYRHKNCTTMGERRGAPYLWSWSGALLFSVTVISTIGYGNIAPRTTWGRVVCIAYAMLGIPLMLLCLANIGDVMADIFRFIYLKVCCCGCCRRKKTRVSDNPESSTSAGSQTNGWTEPPSMDSDEEDEDEESKITVPLTVTMCVIFAYLMGGSLLFGVWEGWGAVAAFYFCFVTLTTIGFGDLVPGTDNLASTSGQVQMALAGLYVLFGMAIISMCFNLMQDEMVAKFKWLGEKIGLIEKQEEDDDDVELPSEPATSYYAVQRKNAVHVKQTPTEASK